METGPFRQGVVCYAALEVGAGDCKVVEQAQGLILAVAVEAYPEPKALNAHELRALLRVYGGNTHVARAIGGVSEGFVRQNI